MELLPSVLLLLSRRRVPYLGYRESDAGSRRYFGSWYLIGRLGVLSLHRLSRGRYGKGYVFLSYQKLNPLPSPTVSPKAASAKSPESLSTNTGGGTVDLITYKAAFLKPVLKLAEASPGSGSLCGASALVEDEKSIKLDKDRLLFDPSADVKQVFGPLLEVRDNEIYWSHEQIKKCYNKAIAHKRHITDLTETESPAQHGGQYLDHWSITRFLLKYLCSEDFVIPMKRALDEDTWNQPQGPLFDMMAYAVQFWPTHYRKATEHKAKEQGSYYAEAMLEYLKNEDLIRLWWRLKFRLGRIDFPLSACVKWPLLLAAHLGFADVVDFCLEARMVEGDIFTIYDTFTIQGWAIALASWMGHLEIVTKLSDEKFDRETADDTRYLTRALIKASDRGYEEIVDFSNGPYSKADRQLCLGSSSALSSSGSRLRDTGEEIHYSGSRSGRCARRDHTLTICSQEWT